MDKVVEEIGKLLWQRRIFYLSLTLFLSLMVAFTNTEIIEKSFCLNLSILLLASSSIVSCILAVAKKGLSIDFIELQSVDFIMFLLIGWMVGTVTFYHIVPTNSLSLSYLIAVICGIVGGGIPYLLHWIYSVDCIMENIPLIAEEFKQRDEIARIVILANMWEYLAIGIIPLIVALIRVQ
jgi:hypothetical protein